MKLTETKELLVFIPIAHGACLFGAFEDHDGEGGDLRLCRLLATKRVQVVLGTEGSFSVREGALR